MSETQRDVFADLLASTAKIANIALADVRGHEQLKADVAKMRDRWLGRFDAAGWVSVDKELPPRFFRVLLYFFKDDDSGARSGMRDDYPGYWIIDGRNRDQPAALPDGYRVTHWRPMPEPPPP